MGRLCRDNTKTSLAANRTRESRPSGMRGGLAETWAMGQLGTHLAIERASVGNSPPKVIRAALLPDGDRFQPPLVPRCGFQRRLTPSVRLQGKEVRLAGGQGEEMTMWCSTVWCIALLTLNMLAAPIAAGAQQAGKMARVGYLPSSPITP